MQVDITQGVAQSQLVLYQLDIKILNFVHRLINTEPTREILLRQYVTKASNSNSMVPKYKELL